MEFELSTEDRMAIDSLRRHVEAEVLPKIRPVWDQAFPPELAHELMAGLVDYGIGAGWLPEADGGLGLSYLTSGLLYGELARLAPDVAGLAYVSEGASMKLSRHGTAEQKARYLPGMSEGRVIGCGAVTEPGAGSNVRQLRTRALRDGSGWRLSGEKTFISNATVFDIATVLARTGEKEFTIFILDRAEHRFETREIAKLGLNGWSFGSISFDDLRIDDAFRLGDPGNGLREALSGFERARAWVAVIASGIARAALDDAVGYSVERDQFGVPIASHQLVQGILADMACETEAATLLTLKALASLDRGGRADLPTSMAKILRGRGSGTGGFKGDPGPRRLRRDPRVSGGAPPAQRPDADDPRRHHPDQPAYRRARAYRHRRLPRRQPVRRTGTDRCGMSGPLAGLKAVEMAGIGPAPMCGMLLADLGAEIVRIDAPGEADVGIKRPPETNFLLRGRPTIRVDLKDPAGRDRALALIEKADCLIEGFRPGVMERLGLGPDPCLARNPRLVYGRVTGWGQSGPMAPWAGHDLNYIGLTGALEALGRADAPPPAPLNLLGDFGGGALFLALGLLAGVLDARRTGRGQVIDAAIVDGVAAMMTSLNGLRAGGVFSTERQASILDSGAYFYDVYACADGHHLAVGAIEPRFFRDFLARLGLGPDDLPPQEDRSRWAEGRARLRAIFATRRARPLGRPLRGVGRLRDPGALVRILREPPHARPRHLRGGRRLPGGRAGAALQPNAPATAR